ncbi:fungal-specific transcription factor [Mucor lusitanicus CBS 277.49]|uniref:Fungal-specific transcription factor n=2 Tax=Mucor circinelloides f. lusitanicus TaxID=29924 RepID=A0A162ZZQ3_MUCCL|nr:fungal-specific transcription factor [Mucor lusitanicus CBS 277.49]
MVRSYADDLEERIEQMEAVIQQASQRKKRKNMDALITPEIQKNKLLVQRRFRSKKQPNTDPPGLLSNIFEEYAVLDPRNWPSGVAYDSIHYLGDLSALQFLSGKINTCDQQKWQQHSIKRFGHDIVLVADPGRSNPTSSKIPNFQWPEDIHSKEEDIHKYIYTVTGLDRYTSVRLLKIYFSHIHPILPVIDKTEFIKQYRDRVETYPSGELLNAMFGAAARFVECESVEPERKRALPSDAVWDVPVGWSNKFFDQAEYIISKWPTNPTISNVQAIILILNHRGDRDSKSSACWQLGGFAIRMAQLLGLHRNCDDWDIPRNEKETRKRVWWALYITDRFQTAILGRPINLRDEDLNVPYPDAGADIEEVMDAYEADRSKIQRNKVFPRFPSLTTPYDITLNNNRRPQIYELFIQFIKLSEILGRILTGLHTPTARKYSSEHGSYGLVTRLDFELTEWRYAFPTSLKNINLPDFNEDNGHFAPAIASVLLFYFSTLILLHQPFIRRTASHASNTSQQICTSAAMRGMRIASRLSARNFLMCPYSFTLYPIMQFGIIHMYNGKNSDLTVSETAKQYLKSGTELLQRLQHMSKTASRMHLVFKSITENADLHAAEDDNVERNLAEEETHLEENIRRIRAREKDKAAERPSMKRIMDSVMLQKPSSYYYQQQQQQQQQASVQSTAAASTSQPLAAASAVIPPIDVSEEAFTLTQFGFDTTNDTSALDYILQNVTGLSGFTENNNAYSSPILVPQQQQDASNAASQIPTQQPMSANQEQTNIFRNDPNNVFWDLPAAFDWDQLSQWVNDNV